MQIITETFGPVLVAHAPDELTSESVDSLLAAVEAGVADGQQAVVLQMENTDLFDSAGLTALAELNEELHDQGCGLTLCHLSETGRTVFHVTRLEQELEICDSVIDAVTLLQSRIIA